ncbi:hypothetical protein [Haloferax sulfurifontis]|uniref:hypothetical protein n=1 Tax=Haloferax sulfurifontis TaxID=255616 RepID=UPI0012684F41|nr:hypothetical protein [Haloferax sulfurifontis]
MSEDRADAREEEYYHDCDDRTARGRRPPVDAARFVCGTESRRAKPVRRGTEIVHEYLGRALSVDRVPNDIEHLGRVNDVRVIGQSGRDDDIAGDRRRRAVTHHEATRGAPVVDSDGGPLPRHGPAAFDPEVRHESGERLRVETAQSRREPTRVVIAVPGEAAHRTIRGAF